MTLTDFRQASEKPGNVRMSESGQLETRKGSTIGERLFGDAKNTEVKQQLVDAVRQEFGDGLAAEVSTRIGTGTSPLDAGKLASVFEQELSLMNLTREVGIGKATDFFVETANNYASEITALTALTRNGESPEANQAGEILQVLQDRSQQAMAAAGPSTVRSASDLRTPSEVTVHLLAEAKKQGWDSAQSLAKDALREHQLDGDHTRQLIQNIQNQYQGKPEEEAVSKLCTTLEGQLPEIGESSRPTRLQDNLYGRVIDTSIAKSLVEKPSQAVLQNSTAIGTALSDHLNQVKAGHIELTNKVGNHERLPTDIYVHNASAKIQEYLKGEQSEDVRHWVADVPGLQGLRDATTPENATAELQKFLEEPKLTGPDCIATSWVCQKMSIELQNSGTHLHNNVSINPIDQPDFFTKTSDEQKQSFSERTNLKTQMAPWMKSAGEDYQEIGKHRRNESREDLVGTGMAEKSSGISLGYQREIRGNETQTASTKPANLNRPAFKREADGEIIDFQTEAMQKATNNGHVYASGASGTTNILLHMAKHMNEKGLSNVDMQASLVNAAMFVIHDGGHSLQEVLETANLIDGKRSMDLKQGPAAKNGEFSANYDEFVASLDDNDLQTAVKASIDGSIDDVADYFLENSAYAQEGLEIVGPGEQAQLPEQKTVGAAFGGESNAPQVSAQKLGRST